MANTKIVLDRQAVAQNFTFGTTSASGEGLVTINKGTAAASTVVLDVKGSQNIAGDLNLTGNLNITGAINETTVDNLNVTDKIIRVNDGGTTAGAAGAGLQVEGDSNAVIGAITFASGSATKFQIGNGTTQVDIVDTSTAQTLTNKTIGASQISGNISGNAANVTGTVAVGNGGTGATSLTGVIIGNGTSPFSTKTNPSGAFVGDTDTQTLTNKTLTTPQIAQINDATNNLAALLFVAPASSVNQMTHTSAIATQTPSLSATGTDTNISLNLVPKGTGVVQAGGVEVVTISGTQTLTNKTIAGSQITGNISGNAANVTGTVAVANGGTGLTTLTANAVLIGNGTSNPTFVAPGSSGNVLTSNGTTWISQAAGAPSQYMRSQAVTGTQDSSNKIFTIANSVLAGTEMITLNGQVLTPGASNDYVLSGTTLTFQAAMEAPRPTDVIRAYGVS